MLCPPPPMTPSKLQVNYRTTIMENLLKIRDQKPYNYGIQETAMLRLVGGAEPQNRQVPHPHVR